MRCLGLLVAMRRVGISWSQYLNCNPYLTNICSRIFCWVVGGVFLENITHEHITPNIYREMVAMYMLRKIINLMWARDLMCRARWVNCSDIAYALVYLLCRTRYILAQDERIIREERESAHYEWECRDICAKLSIICISKYIEDKIKDNHHQERYIYCSIDETPAHSYKTYYQQ